MDSFRCIHAARPLLDRQLRGHQSSVAREHAADVRKIIQDATLIAFEHVVDQALAHDVHCVLISGDCFDPDDRGLRGPAALVRGIGRLAEHDIPVILHAGRPELWSSWPAGMRLPPNAHRLGAGLATSVSIAREGKLLATIAVDDPEKLRPANRPAGCGGWQIHLSAAELPGSSTTAEMIHLHNDGAPLQGLCADENGPHGFTLTEIDASGETGHTFVPAAPVRWERFPIDVSAEAIRDDLLQDMASRLEQAERHACEKIWLVAWDVTGAGPLFERLGNRTFRDELLKELAGLDPAPGVHIHTYALRMYPAASPSLPIVGSGMNHPMNDLERNLAAELAMRLEERFADPEKAINECLANSAISGGSWEVALDSLFAELDAVEVAHDARRLAMHWFAGPQFDEQGELSS